MQYENKVAQHNTLIEQSHNILDDCIIWVSDSSIREVINAFTMFHYNQQFLQTYSHIIPKLVGRCVTSTVHNHVLDQPASYITRLTLKINWVKSLILKNKSWKSSNNKNYISQNFAHNRVIARVHYVLLVIECTAFNIAYHTLHPWEVKLFLPEWGPLWKSLMLCVQVLVQCWWPISRKLHRHSAQYEYYMTSFFLLGHPLLHVQGTSCH